MKTVLRIIITFLVSVASTGFAQMQFLNPLPQPNSLHSVVFVDSAYGWAGGVDGTLLRTTNGGESWDLSFSAADHTVRSLCFIDRENGWNIFGQEKLARTRDGGVIWSYVLSPKSNFRNAVFFSDEMHGWTAGELGVERTTDGGASWKQPSRNLYGNLRSLFAIDSLHVWAAGEDGRIIGSTDGGVTWEIQHEEAASNSGHKVHRFNKIYFADSTHGWAVGALQQIGVNMQAVVFNTIDGGKSWNRQFASVLGGWLQDLFDVNFYGREHGIASGNVGTILTTSNGGVTWEQRRQETNPHIQTSLFGTHFAGSTNAWGVGTDGHMYRSSDRGITWSEYSSGIPGKDTVENFYDIQFTDPLHGLAVGVHFGGRIYTTEDGGRSWEPRHGAPSIASVSSLDRILHTGGDNIWVAGYNAILHSADGGVTWMWKLKDLEEHFTGIAFPSANVGWAVTRSSRTSPGMIFRTIDGGESWDSAGAVPVGLYDVHFHDADHGWILGDGYLVLSTTDGGITWTTTDLPGEEKAYDIEFVDARHGWIAGTGGLYRTIDGGATWHWTALDAFSLGAVEFVDPMHGWVVGEAGLAFYTVDGGANWTEVETRTYRYLRGLHLIDKDDGWITGARGVILRIRSTPTASVIDHLFDGDADRTASSFLWPNPITGNSTLRYALAEPAHVTIRIFDYKGELLRTLLDEEEASGDHTLDIDMQGLNNGMYLYTITMGGVVESAPFVICR